MMRLTKQQTLRYFQLSSDESDAVSEDWSIRTTENLENDDGGIDFHVFNENFDNLPGTSSSCYREEIKGVCREQS